MDGLAHNYLPIEENCYTLGQSSHPSILPAATFHYVSKIEPFTSLICCNLYPSVNHRSIRFFIFFVIFQLKPKQFMRKIDDSKNRRSLTEKHK